MGVAYLLMIFLLSISQAKGQSTASNISGSAFDCTLFSSTDSIDSPSSVHQLRPSDIRVVGAMGNSITAGFGILSSAADIYVNRTDYRGLALSIGKILGTGQANP